MAAGPQGGCPLAQVSLDSSRGSGDGRHPEILRTPDKWELGNGYDMDVRRRKSRIVCDFWHKTRGTWIPFIQVRSTLLQEENHN